MKDSEFENLLQTLRKKKPSALQMQKWKKAVAARSTPPNKSGGRRWLEIVAASVIGFIIGAFAFSQFEKDSIERQFANNQQETATYEFVLTKN